MTEIVIDMLEKHRDKLKEGLEVAAKNKQELRDNISQIEEQELVAAKTLKSIDESLGKLKK